MIPVYSSNCLLPYPPNPEIFCQCSNGVTLILTTTVSSGTTMTFSGQAVPQLRETVPQAFYAAFTDEEVQL
jgi:hypothetical protein